MNKTLIAYFSASGETGKLAKTLSAVTGGDLFEIRPETAYTSADLNWMDKKSRSSLESADEDCRPAIEGGAFNLSGYDRVYIGFPIWWYTAPRVIQSFIETNDLSGKEIYLFATSGGSDAAKALSDMKKLYPTLSFMGASLLNGPVTKDIGG